MRTADTLAGEIELSPLGIPAGAEKQGKLSSYCAASDYSSGGLDSLVEHFSAPPQLTRRQSLQATAKLGHGNLLAAVVTIRVSWASDSGTRQGQHRKVRISRETTLAAMPQADRGKPWHGLLLIAAV
jgi:hypothetical protein